MCSVFSHAWLFVTPGTVAHQAPLSMGSSKQEYWSGLPFSSPGDLPDAGNKPVSPALAGGFFTSEPPEKSLSLSLFLYIYMCVCVCVCFSSVQLLSHVLLFTTPWTVTRQASLSNSNTQSLLKLMFIKSVMPSNHFILCCLLLLLPSLQVTKVLELQL